MRKLLPLAALVILLAGCVRSDDSRQVAHAAASTAVAGRSAGGSASALAAIRGHVVKGQRYASLPDRGELLAYTVGAAELRTRAYTWKQVFLSEEHALNAIGGTMSIEAPDGHVIRLRYDHHVEHPNGDWTWVGRPAGTKPGTEAIITFGEKAVFGTIPDGGGPSLKITSLGGVSYVIATDSSVVAALPGANPQITDALSPPRSSALVSARISTTTQSAVAEAVPIAAPTVVDLVLGYTTGFASRLGGDSQANTRLTNIVDIANQAYLNSNINSRVRLVKTVPVNYPDNTSNDQTLYDLTGYTCGPSSCSSTNINPALEPLHLARNQYGADLVSLVRNFYDSENGSCGVAWILGQGQRAITSGDVEFGMSVVSDSNGTGEPGTFPSNGYICRDETLAHELGHNMGSAHDVATAKGSNGTLEAGEYGRYPYSFGYKTGAGSGNFYTVMAYGDSGQNRYRVFSSPDITACGGFSCGVANQADNARSLRQTMPVVATFAPSVVVFSDVPPDYWAYDQIKRLNVSGITSGCGDNSPWAPVFCPSQPVLRDQMAVFLLRAKYGSGFAPASVASSRFTDVPAGYWAINWIEKLAADQITAGCSASPPLYCPSGNVTRAEMAVFILRAKYGASYSPPAAAGVFQDVPAGSWAAPWIEKLASDGITSGCSTTPKLYCPNNAVLRDQMAVFLVRAYGL
ncbi:reprolysin-like metallopeptidase [Lysobacter claricitrinus]|uniref:reprolysin-like metallopeptidase n=1 Tax=Lysobacter claricitrinus TaxID=3367728 RepID=UPI0037DB5647